MAQRQEGTALGLWCNECLHCASRPKLPLPLYPCRRAGLVTHSKCAGGTESVPREHQVARVVPRE